MEHECLWATNNKCVRVADKQHRNQANRRADKQKKEDGSARAGTGTKLDVGEAAKLDVGEEAKLNADYAARGKTLRSRLLNLRGSARVNGKVISEKTPCIPPSLSSCQQARNARKLRASCRANDKTKTFKVACTDAAPDRLALESSVHPAELRTG